MTNYYLSPEWEQTRIKRRNYDGNKCKNCGTTKNLQVHHKRYRNFNREDVKDNLITLCKDCHQHYHDLQRRKKKVVCDWMIFV